MTDREALEYLQRVVRDRDRMWAGWEKTVMTTIVDHFYGDMQSLAKHHIGILMQRVHTNNRRIE